MMERRQKIGVLLATLLIVANAAVWFLHRQPPSRLRDSREILRDQRTSQWKALPTASLDEIASTLALTLDSSDPLEKGPNAAGFDLPISFRTLAKDDKIDLIEAIGGAVSAIAANDPRALITYMDERGLKPDPRLLSEQLGEEARSTKGSPSKQLAAIWQLRGVDPHWAHWLPEATTIRVWKPRSMRDVSIVDLGRTESWLWGKDTVCPSVFRGPTTFEQAIRREPALLADVRILIEFDASLDEERSPFFFQFWKSEEQVKWQPLVLKLVRTQSETPDRTPLILF